MIEELSPSQLFAILTILALALPTLVVLVLLRRRRRAGNSKENGWGAGGDCQAMDAHVLDLMARNRKIEAIKLVRECTSMGLKEAKDYVERLAGQDVNRH